MNQAIFLPKRKSMGVRRGAKRAFASHWNLGLRTKIFQKTWRQLLNSD